jgi:BirA family biotin operon repressor/biotin-[acetyl-CoA-carboxylase] ligase
MGDRVVRLDSVPSTSDVAKQLARAGEPHGTVVVAAEQTRGRGQPGRRWASPRGGLWVSLLTRPAGISAPQAGLLNIAAAVAAAEAVSEASGLSVALKWPNDLLVAGRKVGGVLVETSAVGRHLEWAVIGVGVNANIGRDALPRQLRATATTLRDEMGGDVALDRLLSGLCGRVEQVLRLLESGNDVEMLRRWRALDTTVGRMVRSAVDRGWRGRAAGIDAHGRLMVRTKGGLVALPTSAGILIE